jgi:hypothetical protein
MIPTLLLMILANAGTTPPPPADNSGEIITGFVVAVIGAIAAGIALVKGKQAGRAESVQIANQPLQVKLEEHFVTRREFDKLEAAMSRDVAEMKGLFQLTMQELKTQTTNLTQKMERQGERLSEQVIAVSKGAYEGRKGIHQKLNHQGEQIAALEAKGDVAKELGKLGNALTKALKED